MSPTRILLVLDAFAGIGSDEWVQAMPAAPDHSLLLTDFDALRAEPGTPLPWNDLGASVERLADRALSLADSTSGTVEFYVGGQAPLALFAHLGFRLSKFAGNQIFLGRGPTGGTIEAFDLSLVAAGVAVFDHESSLPKSPAFGTGLLALYVDSGGRPPQPDVIGQALEDAGQGALTLVEARSKKPTIITPGSAPRAALELTQLLSRLPSLFPKRDGLALFVAGPTLLAFLVGRSLNRSLIGRVVLTNFDDGRYRITYALPFEHASSAAVDPSPEAELRRATAKGRIVAAIEELRGSLESEDIPRLMLLDDARAQALVQHLQSLSIAGADTEEFSLSLAQGVLSLGRGLLEAISKLDENKVSDLAKLFTLHELVHDAQGLRTTNFAGVGRAAVALEQVDYFADAFAIRTALRLEARRGGPDAQQPTALRDCAVRLIEAALSGIEAFDQLEHGARIERLTERRMRRYLTWHLQLARAKTVVAMGNLDEMLSEPIAVELAPVMGRIDMRRHEKVVTHHTPATSLFAAVGGHLVRVAPSRDLEPDATLQALRTYGRTPLETLMNYVVAEHRSVLAPWRK